MPFKAVKVEIFLRPDRKTAMVFRAVDTSGHLFYMSATRKHEDSAAELTRAALADMEKTRLAMLRLDLPED